MIYISSSCVKEKHICKSIERLVDLGFRNIELSGGTNYYPSIEDDIVKLKDKFELNLLLHNYFPPPNIHFVANIASLNQEIYQASLDHYLRAIELSKLLGAQKFGLHAGYLIDFNPSETGNTISKRALANKEDALERMVEALSILKNAAGDEVTLYLENNVLSKKNKNEYGVNIPFFLVSLDDYLELSGLMEVNLLFDLAHFRVSQKSNEKDFEKDCSALMLVSNYIHLSGNDGFHDQNRCILGDHELMNVVSKVSLLNKTITLEVYDGEDSVLNSYNFLQNLLNE